jgi:methionine sulfoxide reductase heme-binding subunit
VVDTLTQIRFLWKPLVFVLCLAPALLVVTDALGITGGLSANAVEDIQDRFGNWGIRFIMITLTVTPLRQLSGWNWLIRFRRMLGLFAFFYVLMHFLTWLFLDQGLYLPAIIEDIFARPFITAGFAAFLLLIALGATSTNGIRRRMGRQWQRLHNGIYLAAILAVVHYWWNVKLDTRQPSIFVAILAVLLGYRLYRHLLKKRQRRRTAWKVALPTGGNPNRQADASSRGAVLE